MRHIFEHFTHSHSVFLLALKLQFQMRSVHIEQPTLYVERKRQQNSNNPSKLNVKGKIEIEKSGTAKDNGAASRVSMSASKNVW